MTGSFLEEPPMTPPVQAHYNEDTAESGYVWNVTRLWAHQPDTMKWTCLVGASRLHGRRLLRPVQGLARAGIDHTVDMAGPPAPRSRWRALRRTCLRRRHGRLCTERRSRSRRRIVLRPARELSVGPRNLPASFCQMPDRFGPFIRRGVRNGPKRIMGQNGRSPPPAK